MPAGIVAIMMYQTHAGDISESLGEAVPRRVELFIISEKTLAI